MDDVRDPKIAARYVTSIRRRRFVDAWLRNGYDKKAAAIEAGFPEHNASKMGSHLFKTKEVKDGVELYCKQLERKTTVTAEALSFDLEDAFQIAKDTRNPNAMVNAIKAKMTLHNLEPPKQIKATVEDTTPQPMADQSRLDEMLKDMDKVGPNDVVH